MQYLLECGAEVSCLDNFSTGQRHNIEGLSSNSKFKLIEGDIRDIETCQKSCKNQEFVLHQAALGSVPRSKAPITTNRLIFQDF